MIVFKNGSERWPTAAIIILTGWLLSQGRVIFQRYQMKRRNGCLDLPRYHHRDPLGNDLHKARVAATVQGNLDSFDKDPFDRQGRTFEVIHWGSLGQRRIWTCDASNIQTIAALAFDDFEFGPSRKKSCTDDGLMTTDGPQWVHARALIKPIFKRSRISDFDSFEIHFRPFLNLLPRDGATVDIQPLLQRLVLPQMSRNTESLSLTS